MVYSLILIRASKNMQNQNNVPTFTVRVFLKHHTHVFKTKKIVRRDKYINLKLESILDQIFCEH